MLHVEIDFGPGTILISGIAKQSPKAPCAKI